MIIILDGSTCPTVSMNPGDEVVLSFTLDGGEEIELLRSEIKQYIDITYTAAFVFSADDGTVVSPNVCGFFGEADNLPREIRDAVKVDDLTEAQLTNFEFSMKQADKEIRRC